MRRAGWLASLAMLAGLVAGHAYAADDEGGPKGPPPAEPAEYRMDEYRAPTPLTLKGARVVDTREADSLWREKSAVFIDTMPRDVKPKSLPAGTVWHDKARDHIPGSAWLANVGYGATSAEMTEYYRSSLVSLTRGDKSKRLVFYCRAECWMSWNAAKRAMEWGYGDVVWYPDGTDGWAEAGLKLEAAKPYDLPAAAER